MKKIIAGVALLMGLVTFADTPAEGAFSLVNDARGYSYIQINQDMDSFAFHSDFKSIGNSGAVGFFKYTAGLEGDALKEYINNFDANEAQFSKHVNEGLVDLGDVKEGDRIGFYLQRKNGDLVRGWQFATKHGQSYIAFDKNNDSGNSSKDEWMSVEDFSYTPQGGTSGAPLPGPLAILLVGGAICGIRKLKAKKSA